MNFDRRYGSTGIQPFQNAGATHASVVPLIVMPAVIAASVLLLAIADGSGRDVGHDALPLLLLSVAFVASAVTTVVAALSPQIRLGLQMLATYFAVYLLLPGYHDATINTYPFYDMHYPSATIRRAAIVVVLFLGTCLLSYITANRMKRPSAARHAAPATSARIRFNMPLSLVLLLLALASAALLVATIGIGGLLETRKSDRGALVGIDAASFGLMIGLPRTLSFLSFLYALVQQRYSTRKNMALLFVAINLPIFLLTNWPLALARYNLFGYLLAILILLLRVDRARTRMFIAGLFVVGALFIMPAINAITREGRSISEIDFSGQFQRFLGGGDFDGLQSLNNAVLFVNSHGTQGGRQIASAALFFVPRTIWPGKGEPSGSIAAEAAGYKFVNISQPLPGEFYIDFGLIGTALGGVLVGFALARIDGWIDRNWYRGPKTRLIAGLIVGYSVIVYRGSLLAIIGPVALMAAGIYLISRFGLKPAGQAALRIGGGSRAIAAVQRR